VRDDEAPRRAFGGRKRDDSTHGYLDPELFLAGASSERPLDATSCPRGYRLLLKMGWTEGTGLGKAGEGTLAPLAATVAVNDAKLGIGKGSEYNHKLDATAAESGDKRRRLEEGDAASALLRANHEAKMEAIAVDKKEELRPFFCDWCQKQYASVPEWAVHLQSYGHTHTRNMKELRHAEGARRAAMGGSKEEKLDKEAKRAERELAKRMKAAGVPMLAPSIAILAPVVAAASPLTATEALLTASDAPAAMAVSSSETVTAPGFASEARWMGAPIDNANSSSSNGSSSSGGSGGWASVSVQEGYEINGGSCGGGWGSVLESAEISSNSRGGGGGGCGIAEEAAAEPSGWAATKGSSALFTTATATSTPHANTKVTAAIKFGFGLKRR
jgi:hypothetical protein